MNSEKKITNFEKLKELKDYEAAMLLSLLNIHVQEEVKNTEDTAEEEIKVIINWLNESYNDGFILSLSESIEKIKIEHLQPYEYLSKSKLR